MVAKQNLTTGRKSALKRTLSDGFRELGISATVEMEKSDAPGRYRLYVISPDFDRLVDAERMDLLWRVLKERWARQDQLRLTLTLALTEKEAAGTWS